MIALDTRRQQLEAELSASSAPDPVRLHPNMAGVYRRKVRELVDGLEEPARTLAVTEALRSLVDRIMLTPDLRSGRKRATLTIDLEGALAAILRLAADTKDRTAGATTRRPMLAVQNAKGTASGEETAPSESMSKLVAKAGCHRELRHLWRRIQRRSASEEG